MLSHWLEESIGTAQALAKQSDCEEWTELAGYLESALETATALLDSQDDSNLETSY